MKAILLALTLSAFAFGGETKTDDQVFWAKWINTQRIYSDLDLETMKDHLTNDYVTSVKRKFGVRSSRLNPFRDYLETFFSTKIRSGLHFTLSPDLKNRLTQIHSWIDHDMPSFINYLKEQRFESAGTTDRNRNGPRLVEFYFAHKNPHLEGDYMRTASYRFFEFAFSANTWPIFADILMRPEAHPIARILYATIWYYLAGTGWKNWNQAAIDALKGEYDKGKKIVYIAGASDVYQLIKHGIYHIEVIDPLLPSQSVFYAAGWDWLVKPDGDGDEVSFSFPDKNIYMKRTSYAEQGTFKAKLSTGVTVELPKSVTEWTIYDHNENTSLGCLTMRRRFCNQDDFFSNAERSMMISFNELFFVVTPKQINWGINPDNFDNDFTLYVKQLREPVSKETMQNMRRAEQTEFKYIDLGTCTN